MVYNQDAAREYFSAESAGNHSDEEAYNDDTGHYDKRKIRVRCPVCDNVASPLCSPKTTDIETGWRWVGCDHKEPFAKFGATCRKCKAKYTFTVHTPQ